MDDWIPARWASQAYEAPEELVQVHPWLPSVGRDLALFIDDFDMWDGADGECPGDLECNQNLKNNITRALTTVKQHRADESFLRDFEAICQSIIAQAEPGIGWDGSVYRTLSKGAARPVSHISAPHIPEQCSLCCSVVPPPGVNQNIVRNLAHEAWEMALTACAA